MDTIRGQFSDNGLVEHDIGDDDTGRELPPLAIGQDERRMQVRAYNFWAAMLDNRNFPSVDQLDLGNLPDFGPYSVLLDFTSGVDTPTIPFLGDKLAEECGADGPIRTLADVPSRSLLSRITDHYMQILANQAPIGFEAEFVNQRGSTILYRGILLPFASDDDRIDTIYGVINWKELADQHTTDELLLEIDQALDSRPEMPRMVVPMTGWADGPAEDDDGILELVTTVDGHESLADWPAPAFGTGPIHEAPAPLDDSFTAEPHADDMELADWLASARECAEAARGSEDRSRAALYLAIGRAYDFSLAALQAPEDMAELLADAGLTRQDRAPFTPVVKLVFGAGYDKTRLAEFASALAHAHRNELPRGALADHLAAAQGGLKGVVAEERRLRREETAKPARSREAPAEAIARKLRQLDTAPLAAVAAEGSEFALLVARRLESGEVVLVGEVKDDAALLERAARQLLN